MYAWCCIQESAGGRGRGGGGARHEKGISFPLSIQVRGEKRGDPGWSAKIKEGRERQRRVSGNGKAGGGAGGAEDGGRGRRRFAGGDEGDMEGCFSSGENI
jgi:hypothetical protein